MMIIVYIINNDTVGEFFTRVLLNLIKLIVFKVSRFPYCKGLSNGYTCYFSYTHTHTHTRTHARTHTHTHTHTQVRHPADTSNFDHFPPYQDDLPLDDISGWDKDFGPLQETPKFCIPGYK